MERNYKEDQANEIEALESIYYNDFEGKNPNCVQYLIGILTSMKINANDLIISAFVFITVISTAPHKYNIQISTEEYDAENEGNGLACKLVFTYTEKYPDTAPLVEIDDAVNFEDEYEAKLLELIRTRQRNGWFSMAAFSFELWQNF